MLDDLEARASPPGPMIVDLTAVTFVGSEGLGLLVEYDLRSRRTGTPGNSGILAMAVEREERDEQLRRAHAVIFRELEDALRPPRLVDLVFVRRR